jgi:hypothetical protein
VSLTLEQIQGRLEQIEDDLGHRQHDFEQAAEDFHKLTRDFELRLARAKVASSGKTQTERKDTALIAIAASDDDLYERLKTAEGRYEGLKAAVRVMETRTSIGQSLLRNQRELGG